MPPRKPSLRLVDVVLEQNPSVRVSPILRRSEQNVSVATLADDTGSVFAEYVAVLVLVSLGCMVATVGLGVPLYNLYLFQQAILLLPIP